MVKHLPTMWETRVRSLRQEDPLEKENGNPLQYSCLENPMDRGACWAAVRGVVQSRGTLSDFTFTFMRAVKEKGKCISENNQLLKKREREDARVCVRKGFVFLGGRRVPRTWRLRGLCGQHPPPTTICSHFPLCCWETPPF